MDNNTINFKDNQNNFRDLLNHYRKEEKLTDVELQVGDKLFPAHRNVLSLYSPVLKAMISEQWLTTKICRISEEFVDVEIVEDLLSFLYTGSINLTPDNVHSVCMAAHFLQIPTLLDASVNHLCKQITLGNVLPLFLFSTNHELTVLRNSCLMFITANHEKVLQDSQVLEFSTKDFKDLIIGLKEQFDDLMLRTNTFGCVVRWTEKNLAERLDELPVLLKNIPLEELPHEFLTGTVSVHPLVKESFPCIQVVVKAFRSFRGVPNFQSNLVILGMKSTGRGQVVAMNRYDTKNQVSTEVLLHEVQQRFFFTPAVINQRDIVLCGGIEYRRDCYSETGSVDMFHWATKTWTKLQDTPIAMRGPLIVEHKNHLYVAGGRTIGTDRSLELYLTSVLCYSFETKQWKFVNPMINKRSHGSLISYGDHLYAIGGMTNTVERYDPVLDEWRMMASMKHCNGSAVATIHQDKIYACGRNNFEIGFEVYDREKNIWTSLPPPVGERLPCLASLNGKLLAIGCRVKNSSSDKDKYSYFIYEFDISSQKWNEFDKLSLNLRDRHHALVGDFY